MILDYYFSVLYSRSIILKYYTLKEQNLTSLLHAHAVQDWPRVGHVPVTPFQREGAAAPLGATQVPKKSHEHFFLPTVFNAQSSLKNNMLQSHPFKMIAAYICSLHWPSRPK